MTCIRCNPTDGRSSADYNVEVNPGDVQVQELCETCAEITKGMYPNTSKASAKAQGAAQEPTEPQEAESQEAESPRRRRG